MSHTEDINNPKVCTVGAGSGSIPGKINLGDEFFQIDPGMGVLGSARNDVYLCYSQYKVPQDQTV